MQAVFFCDKFISCIPVRECPESQLTLCNVPLLAYLLKYIQEKGFRNAVLLGTDEQTRELADSLHLRMPVQYVRTLASLHADTATLLLRRLCVPNWDMGELFSLCDSGTGAVKLRNSDGTPTFAELHPQGSVLLAPERTELLQDSTFRQIDTPAQYREIQQELLSQDNSRRKFQNSRIGAGAKISRLAGIDSLSVIGNDCVIRKGAELERCVLGDGVQIGEDAKLTDCVICRKAVIDQKTHLENAVIPEETVLQSDARIPRKKQIVVLPEDGICQGIPRWNTAETALRAGAGMSVISRRLAIGYSHRSAESLAIAASAGAVSQGIPVWYAGECALSQLNFIAAMTDCDMLLWVQGEQIRQIRPFQAGGFPLTEQQIHRVQQAIAADACERMTESGELYHAENLLALWKEQCRKLIPAQIPGNPEIHVSCGNSGLRKAAQELFSEISRNSESENIKNNINSRITLSLSGDGTKISVFVSECGMIRWEQLILISLFAFSENRESLIIPADFHPVAEDFAREQRKKIRRISPEEIQSGMSPEFLESFQKQGICTDGVKLFAHVLQAMASTGKTLPELLKNLPEICTIQHELSTELTRQQIERLQESNQDRKVSMILPAGGKLVKLRVHADSVETAAELCGFWEKKLQRREN
ncbi:MAG: hypothetical protein K2H82_01435 [Oscillospiraceae bacterium]|nr:hypothetical protein [Oscillospiraceae bacterium]